MSLRARLLALADAMPSGTTARDRALVIAGARAALDEAAQYCDTLPTHTADDWPVTPATCAGVVRALRDQIDARGEG